CQGNEPRKEKGTRPTSGIQYGQSEQSLIKRSNDLAALGRIDRILNKLTNIQVGADQRSHVMDLTVHETRSELLHPFTPNQEFSPKLGGQAFTRRNDAVPLDSVPQIALANDDVRGHSCLHAVQHCVV